MLLQLLVNPTYRTLVRMLHNKDLITKIKTVCKLNHPGDKSQKTLNHENILMHNPGTKI